MVKGSLTVLRCQIYVGKSATSTIFCFALIHYAISYVTNAFHLLLLVVPQSEITNPPVGGGGEELLGPIFAGYVPLASQNPYPILVSPNYWSNANLAF